MTLALKGEAQEVALAETLAVLALARDDGYRARLASLQAAATEGEVDGEDAETLQELFAQVARDSPPGVSKSCA